jgi:hypothetical protein
VCFVSDKLVGNFLVSFLLLYSKLAAAVMETSLHIKRTSVSSHTLEGHLRHLPLSYQLCDR